MPDLLAVQLDRRDVTLHIFTVADPGFPVGGRGPVRGGRGPLTQALFAKNVCENERTGYRRGDPPMLYMYRWCNFHQRKVTTPCQISFSVRGPFMGQSKRPQSDN